MKRLLDRLKTPLSPAPDEEPAVFERLQAELDRHLAGSPEPIPSFTQVRELKSTAELLRGTGRLKAESHFVALEPPFAPFVHTDLNDLDRYHFALRAAILTTAWERWLHRRRGSPPIEIAWSPTPVEREAQLAFLRATTSKRDVVGRDNSLQFLMALTEAVSFEVVGDAEEIVLQFACDADYALRRSPASSRRITKSRSSP